MKPSSKQFFLIGILVLLLITIPLTLFFVKQQQDLRSSAAPSSNLSLTASKSTVTVGEKFTLDIILDPGQNIPSFVKFSLQFDPQKVTVTQITPDTQNISVTLAGPTIKSGTANVEFGINKALTGYDPNQDITQPFKVATIEVQAKQKTDTPTQIAFDFPGGTQVLSIATDDSPGENVLVNATPALITILDGTVTVSPTPTVAPPTVAPNTVPICTNLTVTPASGSAPLVSQFTATGNDPDGQITKATFAFGDGQVVDVTAGLGTKSVSVQQSHTYTAAGSHSATVIFSDNKGGVSIACTQSVVTTASANQSSGGQISPTSAPAAPTPIPTLPPSESIGTAIGIGGAIILTVIGGILFFIF